MLQARQALPRSPRTWRGRFTLEAAAGLSRTGTRPHRAGHGSRRRASPGAALPRSRRPPAAAANAPAPANADTTLRLEAEAPGTYEVTAWFEVTPAGQPAWQVPITTRAFFVPAAALSLSETQGSEEARSYQVQIERRAPEIPLVLHAEAQPPVEVTPATLPLAADQTQAEVRVRRREMACRTPHRAGDQPQGQAGARGDELLERAAGAGSEPGPGPQGRPLQRRLTYDGYHTDVLTNGVTATAGLHWTQHAWASKESADSHWVQIDFLSLPRSVRCGSTGPWTTGCCTRHGATASSAWEAGRQELAQIDGQSPRSFSRHTFTPTRVTAIRIEQTANGGSEARRPAVAA